MPWIFLYSALKSHEKMYGHHRYHRYVTAYPIFLMWACLKSAWMLDVSYLWICKGFNLNLLFRGGEYEDGWLLEYVVYLAILSLCQTFCVEYYHTALEWKRKEGIVPVYALRHSRETRKSSVSVVDILAGIRNGHLQNTSQKCYRVRGPARRFCG
jgi:hypothetical protein